MTKSFVTFLDAILYCVLVFTQALFICCNWRKKALWPWIIFCEFKKKKASLAIRSVRKSIRIYLYEVFESLL